MKRTNHCLEMGQPRPISSLEMESQIRIGRRFKSPFGSRQVLETAESRLEQFDTIKDGFATQ